MTEEKRKTTHERKPHVLPDHFERSNKNHWRILTVGDGSLSFQWPVHHVTANEEHTYFNNQSTWTFFKSEKQLTSFLVLLEKIIIELGIRTIWTIVETIAKRMRLDSITEPIVADK
jgi:hypothetical protein